MKGPRVNNKIRATEVQLITDDGDNIGIVPIGEALDRAKEVGLDLIEVAPNAKPPVCKIIDYGKYKYEIQKKASQAKKKQKIISLKELKLRPSTDKHDYDFKMKNAKKFISKGDKVKLLLEKKGLRSIIDRRNEKINYKIREHSVSKIPVLMICGAKEVQNNTITIRKLGQEDQQTINLEEAVNKLSLESHTPSI